MQALEARRITEQAVKDKMDEIYSLEIPFTEEDEDDDDDLMRLEPIDIWEGI